MPACCEVLVGKGYLHGNRTIVFIWGTIILTLTYVWRTLNLTLTQGFSNGGQQAKSSLPTLHV